MAKGMPNEIRLIRVYDAPVKLVWESFTEDKHVTQWWGPRGFTLTTKSKELRPQGQWIYTMHGPDGTDYPNITTYHEVVKNSKLVYDHGGNEERTSLFKATVTFEVRDNMTVMDMTMAFKTVEAAREIEKFIIQVGGHSTWDRLGEYLEYQQFGTSPFMINRSFDAPLETLFKMFTQPVHLAKWLPPTGSTMEYLQSEIAEGATIIYKMSNETSLFYGKISYQKIDPNKSLKYTQSFCDAHGIICKPPFEKNWPDRMITTIHFAAESVNETRVTIKWEVNPEANEIERFTFNQAKPGMTLGWTGSFDKLNQSTQK